MRNERLLFLKSLTVITIIFLSRNLPDEARRTLAFFCFAYLIFSLLNSMKKESLVINQTVFLQYKKPPDDDKDDFSKSVVLEI